MRTKYNSLWYKQELYKTHIKRLELLKGMLTHLNPLQIEDNLRYDKEITEDIYKKITELIQQHNNENEETT